MGVYRPVAVAVVNQAYDVAGYSSRSTMRDFVAGGRRYGSGGDIAGDSCGGMEVAECRSGGNRGFEYAAYPYPLPRYGEGRVKIGSVSTVVRQMPVPL